MLAILSPGSQAPLLALWELLVAFQVSSREPLLVCLPQSLGISWGHWLTVGCVGLSSQSLLYPLPSTEEARGQHLGFE